MGGLEPRVPRHGGGGGGWPATFDDVAAGIDHLAAIDAPLDLARVVAVGYSAGGTLALWAAARRDAVVPLAAVVAQAPPTDLEARAREEGDAAAGVRALLGGSPDAVPERYRAVSPVARLPLGVPLLVVQGEADRMVDPAGEPALRGGRARRGRPGRARPALGRRPRRARRSALGGVARGVLAWLEPWGP